MHYMKVYEEMEVQLCSFLTSTLDGGSGQLNVEEANPRTEHTVRTG